jgi:predicted protein tyrosine phosphatase
MSLYNRLANSSNQFQGKYKRVLAVCSAGLLRSPTTAFVLSQEPYNYNTRAAGLVPDFALVPVDEVLIEWADEIVCMTKGQEEELNKLVALQFKDRFTDLEDIKNPRLKPVICLNIPDNFGYRDPVLMEMIRTNYDAALEALKNPKEE